jgi:hypothetical protein
VGRILCPSRILTRAVAGRADGGNDAHI